MFYIKTRNILTLLYSLLLFSHAACSQAQEVPPKKIVLRAEPSNEYRNKIKQSKFATICYSGLSGQHVSCTTEYIYSGYGAEGFVEDCIYNSDGSLVFRSCVNGGHTHNSNRPQTYDDAKPIEYAGVDKDPSLWGVEGVYSLGDAQAEYPYITVDTPQSAGIYSWQSKLKLPLGGGWYFYPKAGVQLNEKEVHYSGITIVGVPNLKQLPDSNNYIKVRSSDEFHKNAVAFAGTESMIEAVTALAKEYNELSGQLNYKLSLNDMSLPMGGVFDDKENWTTPHKSHREGTDADLNRQPGNASAAIPCSKDEYLHEAAKNVLAPFSASRASAVLCEPDNKDRKHLDLTRVLHK